MNRYGCATCRPGGSIEAQVLVLQGPVYTLANQQAAVTYRALASDVSVRQNLTLGSQNVLPQLNLCIEGPSPNVKNS